MSKITRQVREAFANEGPVNIFDELSRARRDYDDFVRVDIVQHHARPLFEHVRIEIIGAHQGDLSDQALMFGIGLGSNDFRHCNFRLKFEQRDNAMISLNHMIGEVGQNERAEHGQPNLACAQSNIFEYCHKVMESQ